MSDESDRVPVDVVSENEDSVPDEVDEPAQGPESSDAASEDSVDLLESEKQKTSECEERLKHVLADFQNLTRKTQSDIENGVNAKVDEFLLDFLSIYDDFVRARDVLSEGNTDTGGLDSILKNMDSMLKKYDVTPIYALGEIFDPNVHEAISVISDPDLDDDTITKEIRKGYISHKRIIRPTLVEISKKG